MGLTSPKIISYPSPKMRFIFQTKKTWGVGNFNIKNYINFIQILENQATT